MQMERREDFYNKDLFLRKYWPTLKALMNVNTDTGDVLIHKKKTQKGPKKRKKHNIQKETGG